jgi:hypothetical protein
MLKVPKKQKVVEGAYLAMITMKLIYLITELDLKRKKAIN